MKTVTRWKFLRTGYKSESGNLKWKLGKWNRVEGELDMCRNGFHCSKTPFQAFSYVQGEILAEVECRGEHLAWEDKECWQEMRIIRAYRWTKKDSVKLAVYVAELVLPIFEKEYPNDKRPREAIDAVKKYLKTGSRKGLDRAARAARAAADAAWVAAGVAAWVAAGATADAAWAAAGATAVDAAWAAARVARAARAAIIKKITRYFNCQVKTISGKSHR